MDHISISSMFLTYYCIFLVTLSFVIAISAQTSAAAHAGGEVADEQHFTYDTLAKNGPHNWGRLNETWKICNTGKSQSPIDIDDKIVVAESRLDNLKVNYKPSLAEIVNRGHDIMLSWTEDAGGITINNTEYKLKQCHWHSPAEHTLNGEKLAMEFHMVHVAENGKIAVVGFLFKLGEPNHFLAKFLGVIQSAPVDEHKGNPVGTIDPSNVEMNKANYYRYIGSLTTPPCTEGVVWTIMQEVGSVSADQIDSMKAAVDDEYMDNARPPQPLNGRTIYLHGQ